ncbi:MAG: AAA family ATPase [Planctomycetes bacterium]|nr:AAA family ATPase [Planctomycetota bacterium]
MHVRISYSDGSKIFRWADPSGAWHSGSLDLDTLPLFATERIREFPDDAVRFVCEGEKSANALLEVGTLALDCWRFGHLSERQALAVLSGTDVVLWPDNDVPGRKHMAQIASALRGKAKSIRFVQWTEAPPKGDAADCVAKLRSSELDDAAIRLRIASMIVEDAPAESGAHGLRLTTLDKIAAEPITWLWTGRIARGKITLIAGDPGLGKSMLTHELAARVTVGQRIADDRQPSPVQGEVILFSAEDGLGDTIRPRIEATRGDVSKVHVIDPRPEGKEGPSWLSLDRDLEKLEDALTQRPNVRLVVFDPLNAYVGKVDAHKDHEIRSILGKLGQLAERHNVAVVLVAHLNKSESNAAYRVGGSMGIVAVARTGWFVVLDPNDPKRRLLLPMKTNVGGPPTGIAWNIHTDSQDRPIIIWSVEPRTETADAVFRAQRGGSTRPKRHDAVAFIESKLTDGPMPSSELLALAEESGFSRNTCFRARDELDVRSTRRGGKWFWALPGSDGESKNPNGGGVGAGTLELDFEPSFSERVDATPDNDAHDVASPSVSDP